MLGDERSTTRNVGVLYAEAFAMETHSQAGDQMGYVLYETAHFEQGARLARDPRRSALSAVTWRARFGIRTTPAEIQDLQSALAEDARRSLDEFANAYLTANPTPIRAGP